MNTQIVIRPVSRGHPRRLGAALIGVLWAVLATRPAGAAVFDLPPPGESLVGQVQETTAKASETLLDIARRFDVGITALEAANPGIDPWLPKAGQRIVIPSQFLLPQAPREGIVVNLPEMRLYYYPPADKNGRRVVVTHPLGIGAEGRTIPLGLTRVVGKAKDPAWVVPPSILQEHLAEGDPLPKVVPPGPDNPLGRYALRLGFASYLIHSTNHPYSVGMRISHGCLRMYPEDIAGFFRWVPVGTPVRIVNQPYKAGWHDGALYLEAHTPMEETGPGPRESLTPMVSAVMEVTSAPLGDAVWRRATEVATALAGRPTLIGNPAPALRPPAEATRGWVVQVGAFQDRRKADHILTEIQALSLPVAAVAHASAPLCRVVVGPFPTRQTALATEARLQDKIGLEGMLRPATVAYAGATCPP